MKTDPAPEISMSNIVEIIDDGEVRSGQVSASTAGTRRRSRWIGPGAAIALLAVVGYGVVSSAVTPNAAAPSTPGQITPQYYVATPPTGYSMYLAEARGETGSNPADFDDDPEAELWATPDATATSGSWFVVSRGSQHSTGRNSYRTIVDGDEVTFEHDPDSGQTRLSFTKNGQEMAITAFGWVDRQLVRLVRSVNLDNSVIRFSNAFFTSDHARVLRADPVNALFGLPVARVGYTSALPTALADHFTITVSGDNVVDDALLLKFALTNTTRFTVGDLPAVVGQSSADALVTIAQWRDGERLITMSGNLDATHLEAIAQTVHQSTKASVHQQVDTASPPVAGPLQVERHVVVSGMLPDGLGWDIEISLMNPASPQDPAYLWWIAQPGDSEKPSETRTSLPGDASRVDTFVEHGRTYILASVPRSMDGAELHVNRNGLPPIITRLRDVDPSLPGLFVASVFLEPVPFTARIEDGTGKVVAFWPNI